MIHSPLTMEHALLGFLRQRPMHGYEIYQQLSHPSGLGLVWRLKQSQLYALLAKLEHAGYVTTTLEFQEARPPRKMFELTEVGRAAFLDWLQKPVPQGRGLRLEFLAKLYFASFEGPQMALNLIERQREACRGWLVQQQDIETLRDRRPFDWLVHQFRRGQIEAMLAWLATCEATIVDTTRKNLWQKMRCKFFFIFGNVF
jgi:DNA-binding PadR family transcriptional regulator